jgi:hypothetical protein
MARKGKSPIKCRRVFEALKRKGYSVGKAAHISNGLRLKRGHC